MDDAAKTGSEAYLARFLALHPKLIDLKLDRTVALLQKLGDPHLHLPPVIHVAGTNGKGSTIAFMRAMLEADGKSVHVYTSPHLVHFNERIRLAGKLVEEDRLLDAFERCEAANDGAAITVFEITTVAALLLFSETPADILLLEVGLGGRYDSTNVIAAPLASVITPVSIDHRDYLGDTLEGIALEKAGIIKRDRPVIVASQVEAARTVIEREAERLKAPISHRRSGFFTVGRTGQARLSGHARPSRSAPAALGRPPPVHQCGDGDCRLAHCAWGANFLRSGD